MGSVSEIWQDDGGLPPIEDTEPPDDPTSEASSRIEKGFDFLSDPRAAAPPIWGEKPRICWSSGEPLMVAAPAGTGKTLILQKLCMARMRGGEVLGLPVQRSRERCLYIAADRPLQAIRSWKRFVSEDDVVLLNTSLRVVRGARLEEIGKLAKEAEAATVFIDSLGFVASRISTDEGGDRIKDALQELVLSGIEVVVAHHTRKQGFEKSARDIDDIYGSQWMQAAFGSVLLFEKDSKARAFMRQVKEPDAKVGPFRVRFDHDVGEIEVEQWEPKDAPGPSHESGILTNEQLYDFT